MTNFVRDFGRDFSEHLKKQYLPKELSKRIHNQVGECPKDHPNTLGSPIRKFKICPLKKTKIK